MFGRIAIVNRGESAMRCIHAVRELNAEHGSQIRTIVLHTERERAARFVRAADEAIAIGGATGGVQAYLDLDVLGEALRVARADAAWVGWGFVSENPEFAELCGRLGVAFVGPDPAVMRALGDKINAKLLAEQADVPVAPWSGGPVRTIEEAEKHAAAIGYPLMIKATSGGGGRGIRRVERPDELLDAFERSRTEALRSFGDDTVFMEQVVSGARHVEVQIIADGQGTAWAVGVRDCSAQRRNQKVVEESASPVLAPEREHDLRTAATRLALLAGYRNAGTVEFLYQPDLDRLSFLEVNPRLQVEHPVTELVTGLDLVKLQLHVAAGGRLEGDPPTPSGHAIEARLNAEDPDRGFAPAPGVVEVLRFPSGPGLRVDTGISEGDTVPPEFDSMLAKIVAWGRDRSEARARLEHALDETVVVLRGGTTNRTFLLDVLRRDEFRSGHIDTAWLDRITAGGRPASADGADVALVAAALDAFEANGVAELTHFYSTVTRGRPQARRAVGLDVELGYGGTRYRLHVARTAPQEFTVDTPDGRVVVRAERGTEHEWRIFHGDRTRRVVSVIDGVDHRVEIDGVAHRISHDDGGVVRAPSPGVVIAVHVTAGDSVRAGAPLAVVEAMKMETTITAPFEGRVRDVWAVPNVQVNGGAPLLTIEQVADGGDSAADAEPAVSFRGLLDDRIPDAGERLLQTLQTLRHLVLGYDVDDDTAAGLGARYARDRGTRPDADPDVLDAELAALDAFADLAMLARTRQDDTDAFDRASEASRDQLEVFLRAFDADADELSVAFRAHLQRAASHYGLDHLAPDPDCRTAFGRVFKARQRVASQVPGVAAVLTWHLDHPNALPAQYEDGFRRALERIIAAQPRASVLGDLAHSVRVAIYDEPLIARTRAEVYAEMRAQRLSLAARPDDPAREDRLAQLVGCPQPLIWLLADRDVVTRDDPLLEVLTRRYYKVRDLHELRCIVRDGARFAIATYDEGDRRVTVVSTITTASEVRAAAVAAQRVIEELAPDACVVDIYTWWDTPLGDDDRPRARRLAGDVTAAAWPPSVERVVVSVCGPNLRGARGDQMPAQDHCTLVRGQAGFVEDLAVAGVHPMIAERLHLWRLTNFDVERLPSSDDVYLFLAVAKENAADARIIAIAEVRDLTPLANAQGVVTALPQLEQVLTHCADDIRRSQGERGGRERLHWNRILLYVWPPVEASFDQLRAAADMLAPRTADLGLEEVQVHVRLREPTSGELREQVVHVVPTGSGAVIRMTDPPTAPLQPLDEYARRVVQSRRRGGIYPYELVPLLTAPVEPTPGAAAGTFVEHDLDPDGRLAPVERPPGRNEAGVVVGVVRSPSARYPEGITRVAILSDPTLALGAVAEPECRRIVAAIDLAERMGVPVEWFSVSSGAAITMDSGTENLDWVAVVLRRLVRFTQDGGEVNVVVTGVNVGAQSYWNAEATMLMHTRGILVMIPDSSMVLTGKQALEFSGSVGADDNTGIGGYDRIMGPNGEAQYWARDVARACAILREHYRFGYRAPGERFPRPAATDDSDDRDVCTAAYDDPALGYTTIGEIFSDETNPGRKRPFDIRAVMYAVVDQDSSPLERWKGMQDAESAVVLDAFLGGTSVCLIGIESRPMARYGPLPSDGPETWTGGTLFPRSSKKVARAINAASGTRPVVVLANLSGFDGSPESMRRLQLEYGAEIGRAVVNSTGPIVFCVISRYHGGAFVVFSRMLNDSMEVVALSGSYASVIGGAPAAAVVFGGEVNRRTRADARVRALEDALAGADHSGTRARIVAELADTTERVRSEKLGDVAAEFDAVHSVERAQQVGSVDRIIPPEQLRPYLVAAVRRGQQQVLAREEDQKGR
jgi:acetyl/propionyl-CoA carboxylase alpha subunit/acetyl-CoA carboxylase carboxyltransferase component